MSITVNPKKLEFLCVEILKKNGVNKKDSQIVVDILLSADLRGIASHGVARLARYVNGLQTGKIKKNTNPIIEKQSAISASLNAQDGLGQPASVLAMNMAINKAKQNGVGLVTVKNSNHYGIAGYYPLMALEHNLLGISFTNTAPLVVPTFGKEMIIGTNPIAFAAPAGNEYPFVLDMATSTVPRGKLEVYSRDEKELPQGWALDYTGAVGTNATQILQNMLSRSGGGITPLGGEGELFGGYKGYGLSMLVDIFSGVLSGSAYANGVEASKHPNVGHFFMAINIENFIDLEEFKKRMDNYIKLLKDSARAQGQEKIYIHGEKEYEKEKELKINGIPLQDKVYNTLKDFGKEFDVEFVLE